MQHTYAQTSLPLPRQTLISRPWVGIGLFGLLVLAYGIFFIRNFSGPLAQVPPGDIDQWEYMGYYLLENLSFTPLPHLNLVNNQTFFPYGTNHVFQGWAFESNIWFALCFRFWGMGPWLNIYYLLSLLIASAGTYLLLRPDYGDRRAWLAGLMVSFLNFYALSKYPDHFAYSTIHWTVLSILTDFLLVRRVVQRQPIALSLILLKTLLLTLCLGLDVGYVLGYALSSVTLNGLFVVGVIAWRTYRQPMGQAGYLRQTLVAWPRQWQPVRSTTMGLVSLMLTLFYVPLLVDVAHQASLFTFANPFAGYGWVHPLRLLMPYFPGFSAIHNPLVSLLHDMPEGAGAGSPGWLLLGLAGVGYWYTPRAVRWAYLPLGIFFVLHLLYHPIRIPTLQIFPWCRFNRMPARATLIYPIIAAILALHLPTKLRFAVWMPLIVVGLLEVITVYQFRHTWKPYYYPASFSRYMERIRQQPGEAVLDWPFCVVGGNSISGELCPLYWRNSTLYAFKRFHGKKTVGQYFGRLHESQIQPFLRAGWPQLLNPADDANFMNASQLTTCFTAEQWQFFDRFYQLNDFAGINLCVDLLPQACVQTFYARYGKPVVTTEVPGVGHLAFIPKPANNRTNVNSHLGKLIRFPCGCQSPH